MPRFVFQVQQARLPGVPAIEDVLSDSFAARKTALGMCADLAKDIVAGLTEDSEWRLDVRDESGKPVFRLSLIAESLEGPQLPAHPRTNGMTNAAIDPTPDELILQQLGAAVLLCWRTLPSSTQKTILDQTDGVIGLTPVAGMRTEITELLSRRHSEQAKA